MVDNIFYVYMLKCWKKKPQFVRKSPKHGVLIYTGFSSDIVRRLYEHKTGKMYRTRKPYTAQFNGLLELGYLEAYTTKKEAMARERKIKSLGREGRIKLMVDLMDEEKEIILEINNIVLNKLKKRKKLR